LLVTVQRAFVDGHFKRAAVYAFKRLAADTLNQVVVFQTVRDQVRDGGDFQLVLFGERNQIRQSRHGAVVIHDFTNHARRVQPRQARNVHCRFGMSGTNQNTAVACFQGEDVAQRRSLNWISSL